MVIVCRDESELKAESRFKSKQASFEERGSLRELSLQPEEVSEVDETLVVVEVLLQELDKRLDVHGSLDLLEFLHEGVVGAGLLKGEDFGAGALISAHLFHG